MFRSLLLYLSASDWSRRLLMAMPLSARMARRFVAGETLAEAISAVKALNAKGMLVTLDHLGENVHTPEDAERSTQSYIDLLKRIAAEGVNSNISLKLTALGLDIGEDVCVANMRRILDCADQSKNFVRIDMEGSPYTERTLQIYRALRQTYSNVGAVIQSYLYRSEKDMRDLAAEGASVRLVKGAYKELPSVAFPEKADVDMNFIKLMRIYLSEEALAKGAKLAIATHDDKMITATKQCVSDQNIAKDRFEFQMLYGIRSRAQEQLVAEGYKFRVYVPYGTQWYPYFMRRLAERPANVWFLLRHLSSSS